MSKISCVAARKHEYCAVLRICVVGVLNQCHLVKLITNSKNCTYAELLMKVLGNPEMAALLTSLAKTMKV
ncbi:hypothetical protein ABID24_003189 [Blautia caecimuris]|uniref:Uncharacterized protein n=1 Tax=Blautia caecimuris TaxID=1796615 RepID=A0ABV2M630_9FIRM